jgi:hypothetical protein
MTPDWVGEVHDAHCRWNDVTFDAAAGALSIRCWQWYRTLWKELLVVFEGLSDPPTIDREEQLPYYELSTIYFSPVSNRVHIRFHAGLSIEYSTAEPRYSFRCPTGRTMTEWPDKEDSWIEIHQYMGRGTLQGFHFFCRIKNQIINATIGTMTMSPTGIDPEISASTKAIVRESTKANAAKMCMAYCEGVNP